MWSRNKKKIIFEYQEVCNRGCEDFEYLRVKIDKEDIQGNYIKKIINKGREITAISNGVCWTDK